MRIMRRLGEGDEKVKKEIAVRKLVRTIYEHFGRSQEHVPRQKLSRNYDRGVVRYDGHRVGEWKEG
eukprot:8038283-Karenia_brevis.AAC.1